MTWPVLRRSLIRIAVAAAFLLVAGALLTGTGAITGACTGWFDGGWKGCCDAHDAAYAAHAGKLVADLDLARCVAGTGHAGMGLLMLAAVSFFGGLFYSRSPRK